MGKIVSHAFQIEEPAEDSFVCEVVIRCKMPSLDGEMNVEMQYEGDRVLAAYLLSSAQRMLED